MYIAFLTSIFLFFISAFPASALTINEIYPAPANDGLEWVELYNESDNTVDLTGYSVVDKTGKQIILESYSITSKSYVLATSKSILNNDGDTITVKDSFGNVVDTITYPGGLSSSKSYARCPDGAGAYTETELITKNSSNNQICTLPTSAGAAAPTAETTQTASPVPTGSISSYGNIVISEAFVFPELGEEEWVELYNGNDFTVILDNWYIDDDPKAGSAAKSISATIGPKSYGIITLSSSIFNNDGDTVALLDFNKVLKDSITYTSTVKGKSVGKTVLTNPTVCVQEPTKGAPNTSCITLSSPTTKPTTSQSTVNAAGDPQSVKTILSSQQDKKTTATESLTTATGIPLIQTAPDNTLKAKANHSGEVLSASSKATKPDIKLLAIVKGLSAFAYLLSLINVAYILHKIVRQLKVSRF